MALFNRLFQSRKVVKSERNIQEDFKYVYNLVTIFYVHLIIPQIHDFPHDFAMNGFHIRIQHE